MKKLLMVITTAMLFVMGAKAQDAPIPVDKDVRIGKLDCGITYYVRSNAKPEKQADFYILHHVGALQEEDNQQGLAHFLEHMAFNGTIQLPDNKLIEWCETVGVKFGHNLNAFTNAERTQYNISAAPIDRPGVLDTCLLILHEWSQFLTLDGDAIDNERGVILEEKRTRNNAQWRVFEKSMPFRYGDSRYAQRDVIGPEDILKNFDHKLLRDFYHRWYRPDLQCIVVVGDFDADLVVEKIKTMFADVKGIENPEAKGVYTIPTNVEPIVGIVTDPEEQNTSVSITIKHNPAPVELNSNMSMFGFNIMKSLLSRMANSRFEEITQKPNAPFLEGYCYSSELAETCDALGFLAISREGESLTALEAIYAEAEKIRRFGFTPSEYEIAVADYTKSAERAYDNRNDMRHRDYVNIYLDNFIKNSAMPDSETKWQLQQLILNQLNVDIINHVAKALITLENQVVIVSAPEKEGAAPSEAEVKQVIEKVRAAELEAYVDNTVKEPLIADESVLTGSKVVNEETDKFESTVWTLANGVKIVVKKTDFKADELFISASSVAGAANVSDADFNTAKFMPTILSQSGVAKFNSVELSKQLSGKTAYAALNVDNYSSGIFAGGSPKDIETILQLIYLNYTQPRFNQEDFSVITDKYKSQLKNIESNPASIFGREITKTIYNNNPRRQTMSVAMIDDVKFDRLADLHKQLFNNAKNFTFVFVGNIELDVLKPLVEKYIGSLPTSGEIAKFNDDGVEMVTGFVENSFAVKMEMPKTSVLYYWSGDIPYTIENNMLIGVLGEILTIGYTEVIREEKGASYGVGVYGNLSKEPKNQYSLVVNFETEPEKLEKLNLFDDVTNGLKSIAENGPSEENLSKIKEFLLKQRKDNLKQNRNWLQSLSTYYTKNYDSTSEYDKVLEELNTEKIQKLAQKIMEDNNIVRVVMTKQED